MADSKREILLDLLARDRTGPATRKASENIEDVGKSAERSARHTDKLGDEINKLERDLVGLAVTFAKTGDQAERLDISKSIRKAQNELRRLNKVKGILDGILPDPEPAAKSFVSKLGAAIASSSGSLASLAGNHVGITIGAAAGAAAAPVLAAALGSVLSAGIGGYGIGYGIALAVKGDKQIQAAGVAAGKDFLSGMQQAAGKSFKGPILDGLTKLSEAGDRVTQRWAKAFDKLAPSVGPLLDRVIVSAERMSDALANVAEKSGPALEGLGDSLVLLSDGIGDFLEIVSDGGPEAAATLKVVAGATADLVRTQGEVIKALSWLGKSGLTGPVLPLLAKHYSDVSDAQMDAAASGRVVGNAMKAAAVAADRERAAIKGLADELKAQTDPVFALLDAQDNLAEAQKKAAEATSKHGAKSREARAATRELATASISLQAAVGALGGSFDGKLTPAMRSNLQANHLTAAQINAVEREFRQAKSAGDRFAKTYTATIRTNYISKYSAIVTDSARSAYEMTKAQIAGRRAEGGPVSKNKAYLVGERRAEVFVPDRDGQIIPGVDRLAGGSGGYASARGGAAPVARLELAGEREIVAFFRRLIKAHNLLEA